MSVANLIRQVYEVAKTSGKGDLVKIVVALDKELGGAIVHEDRLIAVIDKLEAWADKAPKGQLASLVCDLLFEVNRPDNWAWMTGGYC